MLPNRIIMVRVTSNIVNDAKKMLSAWKRASEETWATFDRDFQIRECAGLLRVDHEVLKKRLW